MRAIKNLDSLIHRIEKENTNWQTTVYEATGAILTEELELISNCGRIPFDYDAEYSYFSGNDITEYCDVDTIAELIAYIKDMESYADRLVDVSLGQFSKAELFWAVYERILLQHDNIIHADGAEEQEWCLNSISQYENTVYLQMDFISCDACEIGIEISANTSLEEALREVVNDLNNLASGFDSYPVHQVFDANYVVPCSFEELKEKCISGFVFIA